MSEGQPREGPGVRPHVRAGHIRSVLGSGGPVGKNRTIEAAQVIEELIALAKDVHTSEAGAAYQVMLDYLPGGNMGGVPPTTAPTGRKTDTSASRRALARRQLVALARCRGQGTAIKDEWARGRPATRALS